MGKIVCAVDLGGTKINTGLVTEDGKVIKSVKIPTNASEGPDAILGRIKKSIHDVLKMASLSAKDICGIGVGSPGPLDPVEGVVISPSNLPGWNRVPVVQILKDEFGIPVALNNDANSAALGEYIFGSGKGTKNFVYMTISTGIGGGVIIDGKLYSGTNCNAAEVGHATIDFKGPKCNCGNYGCLEVFASGTGLAKIARKAVESGKNTIIKDIAGEQPIKAEHVFEAAKRGDEVAKKLLDDEAFYLGIGISNIMMFYNPERIAVGGGMSKQWDILEDRVMEVVKERTLQPLWEVCPVVKAELGDDIGVLGAAALMI